MNRNELFSQSCLEFCTGVLALTFATSSVGPTAPPPRTSDEELGQLLACKTVDERRKQAGPAGHGPGPT